MVFLAVIVGLLYERRPATSLSSTTSVFVGLCLVFRLETKRRAGTRSSRGVHPEPRDVSVVVLRGALGVLDGTGWISSSPHPTRRLSASSPPFYPSSTHAVRRQSACSPPSVRIQYRLGDWMGLDARTAAAAGWGHPVPSSPDRVATRSGVRDTNTFCARFLSFCELTFLSNTCSLKAGSTETPQSSITVL